MKKTSLDPEKVSKKWKSRGFSFGIFTDPPGRVWEDFVHETDELVMLVRGEMELEMDGEKIQCSPGEEMLIPARTNHSVRNNGETDSVWFYGYKRGK